MHLSGKKTFNCESMLSLHSDLVQHLKQTVGKGVPWWGLETSWEVARAYWMGKAVPSRR